MTAVVESTAGETRTVVIKSWKPVWALGILTVVSAILFLALARDGVTNFNLSTSTDLWVIPAIPVNAVLVGVISVALSAVSTGVLFGYVRAGAKAPLWIVVVASIVAVFAFLAWAGVGNTVQVPGLFIGTVTLSVPMIFGALGGVVSERTGVVNIAIEGQLLSGAFVAAVVSSITQNPYAGLVGASLAGVLVSLLLTLFALKYVVEQVIVGVVLNVLVSGLTGFLYSTWLMNDAATLNTPAMFDALPIPGLSEIPVIGPALFRQPVVVYLLYVIIVVITFALYRTRWGLRTRAIGEHPHAADTVGIRVLRTQFWNVCLAGAIAGLGGAYLVLASVGAFGKDMTNGAGFIALAAVIFGKWHPVKATIAALLFGFASNLQLALSVIGSPVPSEFMLMLPYAVTILAVAGLVGQSKAPAADGIPFAKS